MLSKLSRKPILSLAVLALTVAACTDTVTRDVTAPSKVNGPNLAADQPFNDQGACLAADVLAAPAGFDSPSLASGHCTAEDIKIATADVLEYSFDGSTFIPFNPATPISCVETTPIFLRINAHVVETATSERTDIGVWIAQDGGNARTGVCNHYNLAPAPTQGTVVNGVSNIDGDQCGDMNNAAEAILPLGVIDAVCQTATPTSTLLHIGSCLGWTQPGGDQVCPTNAGGANGFRFGTIPGTSSKCNCEGFDVPITVLKVAEIKVVKTCVPTNDPGTFDLNIDGSFSNTGGTFGDNKACGTDTGFQEVGAGTNVAPGADHTVSESGFSIAASNYTSTVSCTKNGAPYIASQAYTSPNNVSVHTDPNDQIVCTFVNTRKGAINIVKNSVPDGPTDFAFTSTIPGGANFSLDDDADNTLSNTKSFTGLTPGAYTATEAAAAGFDLTSVSCNDANSTGSTGTRTATINVEAGETVTCTFVNTQQGSITIIKDAVPNNAQDFAFTTTGTGLSGFSLDDDADNTLSNTKSFTGLTPGAYTVVEGATSGWDLTNLVCGAGGSGNIGTRTATINLVAGASVTCTFTNTQRASLVLAKVENGGLPLSRAWAFELRTGASTIAAGTVVASASADVTTGVVTFPGTFTPGAYQLCETGMPVGYLNNITGFTPAGATPEGGDNSTECINITLVSGANGPGGITGVPNPIDNIKPPPPGGDARTIGYWKNWSSCTGGKQYIKAGERNELDKTLDFYLPVASGIYPMGDIQGPLTCEQAVRLLGKSDMTTGKKLASDPAYNLFAQFFAAKLNYAAGAQQCPAATTAIAQAQALLDAINFTGTGTYKNSMTAQQQTQANTLAGILDSYNNNTLACP